MIINSNDLTLSTSPARSSVIHSLRGLLSEGDEVDKCNACRALGAIGATEAIDDLISHLRDEDIDVCIDATEALGRLNAIDVVPQLIDSLKNDPDGELKTAIVKALGHIQSPASIPILLEIAEHQPTDMIIDNNDDWDAWWDMQQQAVVALGNMKAEGATRMLKSLLDSADILDIEHDILKALVNIGPAGEQIVLDQLKTGSALSRRRAAFTLALSSSESSLKALAAAFTDMSDEVRLNALQAIVTRKAVKYLSAIELLKKDRSEKVRQAAIIAFDTLSPAHETPGQESDINDRLLSDPDAAVRSTYLQSLQAEAIRLDDSQLTLHINNALNDKNEQVILAGIPLLLKLADSKLAETQLIQLIARPKLSQQILKACINTLALLPRWGIDLSRLMTQLLNHPEASVRLLTLKTLNQLQANLHQAEVDASYTRMPVDIIVDTLNGRSVLEVEVSTITGKTETPAETETAGDDAEEVVEVEAMSTLESIMQDSARQEKNLNDPAHIDESEQQDDPAMQEYHQLVQNNITRGDWLFNQDRDISVAQDIRRQSARVLSTLPAGLSAEKTTLVVNGLISALNATDLKLSACAAESIAQIALRHPDTAGIEYTYGGLVTQYHNPQWDLKLACIRALAAIRNRAAIPIILSALEHERSAIRIQAIESITDLTLDGLPLLKNAHLPATPPTLTEWVNLLIDLLQDKEAGVRFSAVNNLKRCLQSKEISQQQTLIQKAIEHIVQAAFNNQGGRTRDMALVLKAIEPEMGTQRLVQLLSELSTSYERRFAIEMLEEMYRAASSVSTLN